MRDLVREDLEKLDVEEERRTSGTTLGWVSLISGILSVTLFPLNVGQYICVSVIGSIVLCTVAFFTGLVAVLRDDNLGFWGMGLAVLGGVILAIPILFAMAT